MSKSTSAVLVLLAFGLAFVLGRYVAPAARPNAADANATAKDLTYFPRCLVLVVDQGAVYCGKDQAPKEGTGEYLHRLMKLNGAASVIIHGSDMSRYGEIADLAGKLRQRGVKTISIATKAVPSGARLPVIDTHSLISFE